MAEAEVSVEQAERDRIAAKWLKMIETKMDDGTLNATEGATLMRVLVASGFTLDPLRVPKHLRTKLTENMDPTDPATAEELGIIPFKRKA